jgi:hypothetical protein
VICDSRFSRCTSQAPRAASGVTLALRPRNHRVARVRPVCHQLRGSLPRGTADEGSLGASFLREGQGTLRGRELLLEPVAEAGLGRASVAAVAQAIAVLPYALHGA